MSVREQRITALMLRRTYLCESLESHWGSRGLDKQYPHRMRIRERLVSIREVDAKIAHLNATVQRGHNGVDLYALVKRIQAVFGHSGYHGALDEDLRIWVEHSRRVPAPISASIKRAIAHITKGNESSPVFHELHAVSAWLEQQR